MTPAELHSALDARRRELGLVWWEVEIAVQAYAPAIRQMRNGTVSGSLRHRVEEWLEKTRIPDQSRTE